MSSYNFFTSKYFFKMLAKCHMPTSTCSKADRLNWKVIKGLLILTECTKTDLLQRHKKINPSLNIYPLSKHFTKHLQPNRFVIYKLVFNISKLLKPVVGLCNQAIQSNHQKPVTALLCQILTLVHQIKAAPDVPEIHLLLCCFSFCSGCFIEML